MPRVPQGRGLWDIIMGRPKEDFYIPKTWPDDWPDYGVGGTSPSRVKREENANVNQSESKNSK